jgi:hypothetical protein
MTTCKLQLQNWVVIEILRPTKSKIFIVWYFKEKNYWLLFHTSIAIRIGFDSSASGNLLSYSKSKLKVIPLCLHHKDTFCITVLLTMTQTHEFLGIWLFILKMHNSTQITKEVSWKEKKSSHWETMNMYKETNFIFKVGKRLTWHKNFQSNIFRDTRVQCSLCDICSQ